MTPALTAIDRNSHMMRTVREKNAPYRLSGIRRISHARKRPLNLADFFGEVPANPELCEQIFRAFANIDERTDRTLTENEAFAHGVLAFIYMYPSVEMECALDQYAFPQATDEPSLAEGWNQLRAMRPRSGEEISHEECSDHHVVMCGAALDLSEEPVLLYTPDINSRYFSYQFIDAHANSFAYIGTRATQGREGIFAIVGPGWRGKLSKGLSWIQSLTPQNLLVGRMYVADRDEVPTAREIYYRSTLAPFSRFSKEIGNDLSILPPPIPRRSDLSGSKWFEIANRVLNDNPPPACENDMISLFAHLGLGPGFDFRAISLSPAVRSGLKRAIPVARSQISQYSENMGELVNGWRLTHLNRSIRETNYMERAAIAFQCLTQGSAEEIIYADCKTDLQGRLLSGSKRYLLRFAKSKEPPVKGFWSLTLGGSAIHSNIGSESSAANDGKSRLKYEIDGSLEIYVQAESPGLDRESNWLPSPQGKFSLKLRMYIPGDEVVSGVYQLPGVECL